MVPCPFCSCERTKVVTRDDEDVSFMGKTVLAVGVKETVCQNCSFIFQTHEQHDENIGILRVALKS